MARCSSSKISGSSFGTQINGAKLPKGEKHLLRNGDIIAIAQFDVTFDRVAENSKESGPNNTQFVARRVVKDVMRGLSSAGEQPYFRIMNGLREGERIEIADAQEYIIGRDDDADIIFKDDLVSRKHVKVRRDWSGVHVEDLGSRNGIKINKKKTPKKTLQDRDEVEVGGVRLLFLDPNEVREAPVVLPEGDDEEDEESTHMNKDEDEAPKPEEPAAEAPAEEAPPPAEEPAPEEPPTADAPPDEEQSQSMEPGGDDAPQDGEDGQFDGASQQSGIGARSRGALIGLAIAGVVTLVAIVFVILILVGA